MVTINEVAKAAGVSISTVSYALSGKRTISQTTRQRIDRAIRDLGYRPHAGARMLAGARTHILALSAPLHSDAHLPTHMRFVTALVQVAREHEYDVLLLATDDETSGIRRVADSSLVDGVVAMGVSERDERVPLVRELGVPAAFIGVPDEADGLACVDLDFGAAGHLEIDRLADAGHSAVHRLGQTEVSYRKSNFPRRLLSGVQERAADRSVALTWSANGGATTDPVLVRRSAEAALDDGIRAFVVHAVGDVHDVLLEVLRERGLALGDDVSVISAAASFDTSVLAAPIDTIPLVPQQSCEMAVDIAVRHLDEANVPPEIHLIAPEYHDAGSVRPPRG